MRRKEWRRILDRPEMKIRFKISIFSGDLAIGVGMKEMGKEEVGELLEVYRKDNF